MELSATRYQTMNDPQVTAIVEVPITLRPDTRHRSPHLKRWRDGMRHLLQILSASPTFFFRLGLVTVALNWGVLLVGLGWGPIPLPYVNLFGLHTMMFALLGTLPGSQHLRRRPVAGGALR